MPDATPENLDDLSPVIDRWQARTMQTTFIVSYIGVVLAVLIPLAIFVFDSIAGIMTLAATAVGAIVPLLPNLRSKIEYRLSEAGLEKRRLRREHPAPFKELFRFPDLDYIVPNRRGFIYYKKMEATTPLRAFINRNLSDNYSGEVHLETADRERVLARLAERGVGSTLEAGGNT